MLMPIIETKGPIESSKEKYICLLQCVSEKELKTKSEPNLARVLSKYPYANTYQIHKSSGKKFATGTFKIFGDGKEQPYVAVLFTASYPGLSKFPNDAVAKRKEWFKSALKDLGNTADLNSIAFDYGNLFIDTGNDLKEYKQLIGDFEATYELTTGSKITIIIYNDPATIKSSTSDDISRGRPAFVPFVTKPESEAQTQKKPTIKKTAVESNLNTEQIVCAETEYGLDDFCKYIIVSEFDAGNKFYQQIDSSWNLIFSDPILKANLDTVHNQLNLKDELVLDNTFPPADEIFNAFNLCNFNKLSVVILGQDPYPTRGNAHGLSFSVREGVAVPASLKNIYNALENDDKVKFTRPKHGCLSKWAEQGVLLLNSALTVKEGKPETHLQVWEQSTDKIIQLISQKSKNVVFMLWGKKAQAKNKLIDKSKHCILEYNHPSPQVSGNKFGTECKHFSEANDYLKSHSKKEIIWQL